MVYYSIKDVAEITGLSVSTVKRRIKKIKSDSPKEYAKKENVKSEKTKNGSPKTLISKTFLDTYIHVVQVAQGDQLIEPPKQVANQEFIEHLKQQVVDQRKEIKDLQEARAEDQKLITTSVLAFQELKQSIDDQKAIPMIEAPKKKSWVKRLLNK